jgi:hypothetical protein
MPKHLDSHQTALPPPLNAGTDHESWRPRLDRVAPAAAVVGTLLVIALAIVSALTLLATTPAGIAIPTTLLLIGGLIAGSLAIRTRVAPTRRANPNVPRSRRVDRHAEAREPRARTAREDRAMPLPAGWGES